MLTIDNDVYGPVSLSGGLLADLVASQAVQRLDRVSQAGASSLVRSGRSVTRYEHSIGVMMLTRILGGTETEQAAGLLQDVSHTAFSHTIDYVFEDRREEFHERIFKTVIEASDIPTILGRYELAWHDLFSPNNLKRVDVPAPRLCADRIDYTLRDLLRFGYISQEDAANLVSALRFVEDIIVFTDVDSAARFVELYKYLVSDIFMNPLELYAHAEMARIVREALRLHILEESDLLATDDVVLTKLQSDKNHGLSDSLTQLRKVRSVIVDNSSQGYHVYGKGRIVDPPVLTNGSILPLSKIRPETLRSWTRVKAVSKDGIFVRPKELGS